MLPLMLLMLVPVRHLGTSLPHALPPAGNYRVDEQAGKGLLDSLMWK